MKIQLMLTDFLSDWLEMHTGQIYELQIGNVEMYRLIFKIVQSDNFIKKENFDKDFIERINQLEKNVELFSDAKIQWLAKELHQIATKTEKDFDSDGEIK